MKPIRPNILFQSHSPAKSLKNYFPGILLATLVLSVSAVRGASPTTFTWDSDGVFSNGQTDGAGTISAANLNFMNATADVVWSGSGNSVVFGVAGAAAGSSYTVNNAYANDLFQPFALTFKGGTAYTLTGGRINVGALAANGLRLNSDVTATQTLGLSFAVYNGTFFTNNATTSSGLFNITGGIITQAPTGGGLLTLTGTGTGMNTMSGSMTQSGQGALALAVAGGAWTLSNTTSAYTGAVSVTGGTLSVSSDANLGGSAGTVSVLAASTSSTGVTFGSAPTGKIGVGSVILGSTVSAATSSTVFALAGNASQTISSATNVAYATAAALNLDGGVFQATGTFSLSESKTLTGYTATANRAIVLGNANGGGTVAVTGANVLTAPGIVSGSGALTKTGTGTLTLTGANTYTGATTISTGTLQIGDGTTDGSIAASAGITNNSALLYNLAGSRTYGNVISGSGTLTKSGAGTLTLTGVNTYTGATTINTGGTLQIGDGTTDGSIAASAGIADNGALLYNLVGSRTYGNVISGSGTLTKTGAGTLTLSGANTYSGATTVNAGTLALVGGSQTSAITLNNAGTSLGFTLASGTSSTSTVTFGAGTTVKITDTPTLATYTLMTVASNGFAGGITPVLAAPIAGYTLSVTGGNTLVLAQTPVAGYSSWATLNGASANLNEDSDGDGVSNGIEYFIGGPTGHTTGFTALPGVVDTAGVLSVTWAHAAGYTGLYGTDFSVETSTTLEGTWTQETNGVNVTVTGDIVKYTFPAGPVKTFARLKVTGP